MRLKEVSDYVATSYKAQIKEHYKAAHNFRVGLEIKPTSFLALRGGFGYQGNALRDGVNSSNQAISGELAMFNRYDNPVVYKPCREVQASVCASSRSISTLPTPSTACSTRRLCGITSNAITNCP